MTPEKSKAIQDAMQEAAAKADAEAVTMFGAAGGEACAALADLANQMKYLVMIIEGDMTSIAMKHAEFLARAKHAVCDIAGFDQNAFGDTMLKIAATRLYVHQDRKQAS